MIILCLQIDEIFGIHSFIELNHERLVRQERESP